MQPVMRPVFDTMSTPDVLVQAAGKLNKAQGSLAKPWLDTVKAAYTGGPWDASLQTGGVWAEPSGGGGGSLSGGGGTKFDAPSAAGDMPLVVYASSNFHDGRGANKPWLQELPDPVTKIVWDHWVEMHPDTAKKLGVVRGDMVSVKTPAGTFEAPVYDYLGIRPGVLATPTGQGHVEYGRYARGRGANVMAVLPVALDASGVLSYTTAASVAKSATPHKLVYVGGDRLQGGQSRQFGRPIALAIPLTEVGKPLSAEEKHEEAMHEPGYVGSTVPPDPIAHAAKEAPNSAYAHHANHRWAMAIDLNSCTGCSACIVACSAENNVAVVGKEQVARGRELMWLRLERYYEEHEDGTFEVRHVPMMCQQCGAAPCESVCPVYATYHNPEGLNAMIYNRCVGTRYCSNNCPYKVRAFNWFSYKFPEPLNWQLNPDVTVRDKGVMEKCTFCVQRIRLAKDAAKDENRKVRDGDVVTACQQTCPSKAIVFGDLMDPESEISKRVHSERGYKALGDLNTYPSVTYLKKVLRGAPPA
jgi:molybdopterin-containing oxidoreductase family iron-sulfur binding subunit